MLGKKNQTPVFIIKPQFIYILTKSYQEKPFKSKTLTPTLFTKWSATHRCLRKQETFHTYPERKRKRKKRVLLAKLLSSIEAD